MKFVLKINPVFGRSLRGFQFTFVLNRYHFIYTILYIKVCDIFSSFSIDIIFLYNVEMQYECVIGSNINQSLRKYIFEEEYGCLVFNSKCQCILIRCPISTVVQVTTLYIY